MFARAKNEKEKAMKRITSILIFTLALLVAGVANAQMDGGPHRPGGGNGPSGTYGAWDMPGMGIHRGLVVGEDGTAYTLRVTRPTTTSAASYEIVAVRQSGAIAWTAPVSAGMTFIVLSGNHLLVAARPYGFNGVPTGTPSSKVIAFSTASGAVAWTLDLDGFAADVEPFAGGTYILVVEPSQSSSYDPGNGPYYDGTRTLVAVGADGGVLWNVPLTN
jgi:hypothetical protein